MSEPWSQQQWIEGLEIREKNVAHCGNGTGEYSYIKSFSGDLAYREEASWDKYEGI